MKLLPVHGTIAKVVLGILATGAILNLASSGKLGTQAKTISDYITKGYGV